MYSGVVKAWHIHKKQIDWWYVAFGRLQVALYDVREGSPTLGVTRVLQMGDHLPSDMTEDSRRSSALVPRHWWDTRTPLLRYLLHYSPEQ